MYPSLNLPVRIMDLRVVQRANTLVIDFTIPSITTDGVVVKSVSGVELRVGDKEVPVARNLPGPVHVQTTVDGLVGQDVLVHVRLINAKGHASEWSNPVTVAVAAPLAPPAQLLAANDPVGVKLTWYAPRATHFRIFRRAPDDKTSVQIGESDSPEYIDKTTALGKTYVYSVQALNGTAESDKANAEPVTTKDVFPPAVPHGLRAAPGLNTVELAWERNTEPDFRGYRVYRSVDHGPFERIADAIEGPSFSDKNIQAGKHYRYTVSAVDQVGNESSQSAPIEITP
jgi:fibronectin type 3 domain-containing protein